MFGKCGDLGPSRNGRDPNQGPTLHCSCWLSWSWRGKQTHHEVLSFEIRSRHALNLGKLRVKFSSTTSLQGECQEFSRIFPKWCGFREVSFLVKIFAICPDSGRISCTTLRLFTISPASKEKRSFDPNFWFIRTDIWYIYIFINVQHYSGFPVDYFLWYILVGVSLPYWPVITKIGEFFQQPTSLNELCLYYPVFCLKGNSGAFAWWSTSARWWCWATWMWIINRFQIQNINTSKGSGFGNLDGKQDCFSMLKNDVAFWKLQKISNFQDQICWSKATIVCGRHHILLSRNGSVRELRLPQIVQFMGILDNPWPLKFLEIAGFQQTQPKFLSFRCPSGFSQLAKSMPCTRLIW